MNLFFIATVTETTFGIGPNMLVKTNGNADTVAGGPKLPFLF